MPDAREVALILQDECYKHRYIRSKDVSLIVERPERLRALKVGFAAAIARIEEARGLREMFDVDRDPKLDMTDGLTRALEGLDIKPKPPMGVTNVCDVVQPPVTLQYLSSDPAVRMVHAAGADGEGHGDMKHLDRLAKWARESEDKIRKGESEIPQGFSQGDLYMCPQSYGAICGAVEAVRQAVDTAMQADEGGTRTAFAAIRPPGHHCGEDSPSGFCFVNNVAVGAAHAHLQHGVKRVIIFDIDLHHGNGTQAIAWAINAETHRRRLTLEARRLAEGRDEGPVENPGLQIFYGSLHDILSFPCEDGDPNLVRDASVSLSGAHGQFMENVHLQPYSTHEEFWRDLYPRYRRLFAKAEEFLRIDPQDTNVPIFISCGFDASELEYESMSRHGRKVPVGFYYRFAKDARRFAKRHGNGRVVSILEGGYSDRALIAGGMAHLVGLVEDLKGVDSGPETWWSEKNLGQLEKATKPRKGKLSIGTTTEGWVERSVEILAAIDPLQSRPLSSNGSRKLPRLPGERASLVPSTRLLRDRSKQKTPTPPEPIPRDIVGEAVDSGETESRRQPTCDRTTVPLLSGRTPAATSPHPPVVPAGGPTVATSPAIPARPVPERKLPRVILRVREPSAGPS